jgi:hypothetical protein
VGALGLRDAQVLDLRAGDLAVEIGVAEQGGVAAVLADPSGLAPGVEAFAACDVVPARHLGRAHDPVADLQRVDVAARATTSPIDS